MKESDSDRKQEDKMEHKQKQKREDFNCRFCLTLWLTDRREDRQKKRQKGCKVVLPPASPSFEEIQLWNALRLAPRSSWKVYLLDDGLIDTLHLETALSSLPPSATLSSFPYLPLWLTPSSLTRPLLLGTISAHFFQLWSTCCRRFNSQTGIR